MIVNITKRLNRTLLQKGYSFHYKEIYPTNSEEMYEFRMWFEDLDGNKYPFKSFWINNPDNIPDFNYKRRAFTMLLDIIFEDYFKDINKFICN